MNLKMSQICKKYNYYHYVEAPLFGFASNKVLMLNENQSSK